ncbi:MAG: hypothetical protein KF791_12310 [Verrucomicrobiae bacterium]|nr:hypothetical protein [Verrucomicrobiae bacterium]
MRSVVLWAVLTPNAARAIITYGAGNGNTTRPPAPLEDSGWISQTDLPPSATAVGRHHFLTATHVGTQVGGTIHFDGLTYTVVRTADAPGTDLRLLEIAGRLATGRIAVPYTGTDEVGRGVVLHGHGWGRGTPVFRTVPGGEELRGWLWGGQTGRLRWGTNVITGVTASPGNASLLVSIFSSDGGDHEATVASGDSGGGVFLLDASGRWVLAGVIYDVEARFRQTVESPSFSAALFDRRGFFARTTDGIWAQIADDDSTPGTIWQASRVSPVTGWLATETQRSPSTSWPVLRSSMTAAGPYREHEAYAVNPSLRVVRFKNSDLQRFFQLDGESRIQSIEDRGDFLEIQY